MLKAASRPESAVRGGMRPSDLARAAETSTAGCFTGRALSILRAACQGVRRGNIGAKIFAGGHPNKIPSLVKSVRMRPLWLGSLYAENGSHGAGVRASRCRHGNGQAVFISGQKCGAVFLS